MVEPAGEESARLLVRTRGTSAPSVLGRAFDRGFFEPAHFVMERRMMEGIRAFAEGRPAPSRASERAEVLIWATTVAVFVWGIVALVRRKRWVVPLAVTAQPPPSASSS